MKIQKILTLIIVFSFCSICFLLSGFSFFKSNNNMSEKKAEISSYSQNDIWCITFQLVWNEFMDKFADGKPVNFEGTNPSLADELNKKTYSKEDVSSSDYYIVQGEISPDFKKKIEKDIYNQFKEKSDILDFINWNARNSYLFYSMLKKEFNFLNAFDKLDSASFNNSSEKVKFFGIKKNSDKKLYKNTEILFYNSPEEYAVKLLTKENEDVILFRTNKNDSFEDLYSYIEKNSDYDEFTSKDILIIPEIVIDETISYDELCNKRIKGTNYIISQALQTIKFKMNNKGGSLKSEAAIAVMRTSLVPPNERPRYFIFDKPFVLFLKEHNKNKPYYAMKVDNIKYLAKE